MLTLLLLGVLGATAAGAQGWPEYGGAPGGQRYASATEINRRNIDRLTKAWTLDVRRYDGAKRRGSFEATPVLWHGTLYLTTPKDVVLAVNAATGKEIWKGDLPGLPSGTPMTYVVKGKQYVVIATGDEKHGDMLVAFALGK